MTFRLVLRLLCRVELVVLPVLVPFLAGLALVSVARTCGHNAFPAAGVAISLMAVFGHFVGEALQEIQRSQLLWPTPRLAVRLRSVCLLLGIVLTALLGLFALLVSNVTGRTVADPLPLLLLGAAGYALGLVVRDPQASDSKGISAFLALLGLFVLSIFLTPGSFWALAATLPAAGVAGILAYRRRFTGQAIREIALSGHRSYLGLNAVERKADREERQAETRAADGGRAWQRAIRSVADWKRALVYESKRAFPRQSNLSQVLVNSLAWTFFLLCIFFGRTSEPGSAPPSLEALQAGFAAILTDVQHVGWWIAIALLCYPAGLHPPFVRLSSLHPLSRPQQADLLLQSRQRFLLRSLSAFALAAVVSEIGLYLLLQDPVELARIWTMLRPVVLICLATSFPLVMLLESTLKHPLGLRGLLADGAIAEVLAPYLVALIAPLLSWFLLLEVNRRGGLYAELPLLLIAGAANEILLQQSVRSTLARADLVGTRTES